MKDTPQIWRRVAAGILVPLYLGVIFACPVAFVGLAGAAYRNEIYLLALGLTGAAPVAYVLAAGLLSRIHMRHVREGRMPVDAAFQSYFHRRMYGLCWTAIYYSGPVYFAVLSLPWLKALTFRLFGYRGSLDFTIYPDTWIRDLPLLDFGSGSYLSNKATIGSNMIFIRDGKKIIEVGAIRVGERSMVGHLSAIGPSTEIGDDVQIGVFCGIGRRVRIGSGAIVSDRVTLDHGVTVEEGAVIPTRSYASSGSRIATEDRLQAGDIVRRERRRPPTLLKAEA